MAKVSQGDVVRIHCKALSDDGKAFSTPEGGEPLEFMVGNNEVIKGLTRAVMGMQQGEKKTVTVPPQEGFGARQNGRKFRVRRSALAQDVKIGDRLSSQAGDQVIPVWVSELGADYAIVDANHPLAGKSMVLQIELVSVQPGKTVAHKK